jgi:hypothetical protein
MVKDLYESVKPVELANKKSDNDAHDIFVTFVVPGVYTIQVSGRSPGYAID